MVLGLVFLLLGVGFLGWTLGDATISPELSPKLIACGVAFIAVGLFFILRRFRGPRPDREERRRRREERRR